MVMSAEQRSKFAALHRQWWRLHMSEKFSSRTKNSKTNKQTNKHTQTSQIDCFHCVHKILRWIGSSEFKLCLIIWPTTIVVLFSKHVYTISQILCFRCQKRPPPNRFSDSLALTLEDKRLNHKRQKYELISIRWYIDQSKVSLIFRLTKKSGSCSRYMYTCSCIQGSRYIFNSEERGCNPATPNNPS